MNTVLFCIGVFQHIKVEHQILRLNDAWKIQSEFTVHKELLSRELKLWPQLFCSLRYPVKKGLGLWLQSTLVSILWFTFCNIVPLLVGTLGMLLKGWPNACYDRVPPVGNLRWLQVPLVKPWARSGLELLPFLSTAHVCRLGPSEPSLSVFVCAAAL